MKPSKNITKVKWLLENNTEVRDNDNALIAAIWYDDIVSKQIHNLRGMTGYQFLDLVKNGKLTSTESIRRCRQKLQKEFPELRGNKYNARHQEKENVLKDLFETPEFYKGGTP